MFGAPAHAEALLRQALPPELIAALDWGTLRECSHLLVDVSLAKREADLLFAVERRDGAGLVLPLVEHLSTQQREDVLRLRGHAQRLCEKMLAGDDRPEVLPVVVPLVVHQGPSRWRQPTRLGALRGAALPGAPGDEFAMLVFDLGARTEAELLAMPMPPMATLALLYLRTVRGSTVAELAAALERWAAVLRAAVAPPGGAANLQVFHAYVLRVAAMPADELAAHIERILGPGAGTDVKTTAERLIEEGMSRGKAELLLAQLARRFGPVTPTTEARVRAATEAQLDAWGTRIFDATSLDDLFAHG